MGDIDVEAIDKAIDALTAALDSIGIQPQVGGYQDDDAWDAIVALGPDESARLTAALIELARLRSVVAGVEALAEELERESQNMPRNLDAALTTHKTERRLRSVLSDTKGDAQ